MAVHLVEIGLAERCGCGEKSADAGHGQDREVGDAAAIADLIVADQPGLPFAGWWARLRP
jgi:hypothetical protein